MIINGDDGCDDGHDWMFMIMMMVRLDIQDHDDCDYGCDDGDVGGLFV